MGVLVVSRVVLGYTALMLVPWLLDDPLWVSVGLARPLQWQYLAIWFVPPHHLHSSSLLQSLGGYLENETDSVTEARLPGGVLRIQITQFCFLESSFNEHHIKTPIVPANLT